MRSFTRLVLTLVGVNTVTGQCYYSSYAGDGYCDYYSNNAICSWDGGDCCESTCVDSSYTCGYSSYDCKNPSATDYYVDPYPNCYYSSYTADGDCDSFANYAECGWDGGDCCNSTCVDDNCGPFYAQDCKDPTSPDFYVDPYPNCASSSYAADGDCDSFTNTPACGWDGGDCCNSTCVDSTYTCGDDASDYACTDPSAPDAFPECEVSSRSYLGDGDCDGGDYNGWKCGWDGGDCCESTCTNNTYTCGSSGFDECKDPNSPGAYPECGATSKSFLGDGDCDGGDYNTMSCSWDGGDCCNSTCVERTYSCSSDDFECKNPDAPDSFPDCNATNRGYLGDRYCDGDEYNIAICGWDGGDCCGSSCLSCSGQSEGSCKDPNGDDGPEFPLCSYNSYAGDGDCDYYANTPDCGWDGGDCCNSTCVDSTYTCSDDADSYYCRDPSASDAFPGCDVSSKSYLGDGDCDGSTYNTLMCGWDGGDCCNSTCVSSTYSCSGGFDCRDPTAPDVYPMCDVSSKSYIGDGDCDGGSYNTFYCNWDGGDCCNSTCVPNTYDCSGDDFECLNPSASDYAPWPYCTADILSYIGDGYCDYGDYNVATCGWDGGDCCASVCVDAYYECGTNGFDCLDEVAAALPTPAPVYFTILEFYVNSPVDLRTEMNIALLQSTVMELLDLPAAALSSFNVERVSEGRYIVLLTLYTGLFTPDSAAYIVSENLAEQLQAWLGSSEVTVSDVAMTNQDGTPVENAMTPPVNSLAIGLGVFFAILIVVVIVVVVVVVVNKSNTNKHVKLDEEPTIVQSRAQPYQTKEGQEHI